MNEASPEELGSVYPNQKGWRRESEAGTSYAEEDLGGSEPPIGSLYPANWR